MQMVPPVVRMSMPSPLLRRKENQRRRTSDDDQHPPLHDILAGKLAGHVDASLDPFGPLSPKLLLEKMDRNRTRQLQQI